MEKARAYVEQRLKATGVEQIGGSWTQEFEFAPRRTTTKLKGVNFVGSIRGKQNPERYIVVTAHYDHDGIKNGEIYNGADDNASGVAGLFAVASHFSKHPLKNTLIIAALDAEEAVIRRAGASGPTASAGSATARARWWFTPTRSRR